MSLVMNPLVSVEHSTAAPTTAHVDAVRSELLARRAEHSARLQTAHNQTTTLDDDGAIDVGLAFERFSIDRSRDAIIDIDAAIDRLDAGTYGSCETCFRSITPERLEALPHTRYCITCADLSPPAPTGGSRS